MSIIVDRNIEIVQLSCLGPCLIRLSSRANRPAPAWMKYARQARRRERPTYRRDRAQLLLELRGRRRPASATRLATRGATVNSAVQTDHCYLLAKMRARARSTLAEALAHPLRKRLSPPVRPDHLQITSSAASSPVAQALPPRRPPPPRRRRPPRPLPPPPPQARSPRHHLLRPPRQTNPH